MKKVPFALRAGAALLGMGLLAACQGPDPAVDTTSRRERMGAPMPPSAGAPLRTDPAGNTMRREQMGAPLAPGSSGTVSSGTPAATNAARERSQTPPVLDSNRGAPL